MNIYKFVAFIHLIAKLIPILYVSKSQNSVCFSVVKVKKYFLMETVNQYLFLNRREWKRQLKNVLLAIYQSPLGDVITLCRARPLGKIFFIVISFRWEMGNKADFYGVQWIEILSSSFKDYFLLYNNSFFNVFYLWYLSRYSKMPD